MKINQLTVGNLVTFTKKPLGSYLSENTPYLVESIDGQTVHFRNPVTGGGTFDKATDLEFSEYMVREAA